MFERIKRFFRKIKIGSKRICSNTIPFISSDKRYGQEGENYFYNELKLRLPDAIILSNVCLNTEEAKGDVDFIIIIDQKIFVIELKSWKGTIYSENGIIYKDKESYEEVFTEEMQNPFKQLNNIIFKMKKRYNRLWFEKIVFFLSCDTVYLDEYDNRFTNFDSMFEFMKSVKRKNDVNDINYFLNNVVCYDSLYRNGYFFAKQKFLITDDSINTLFEDEMLRKRDISAIHITHHYSYDDLEITLKNGEIVKKTIEIGSIKALSDGQIIEIGLSKIDEIVIGN